ncbi:AAA family ATPase [Mucilaginibacter sp. RS28]|uniref:AAA family ATPase n=1 Tax=Mucilaginibacter straminoryzae TaxID=2932774 RepID=A0A9X2BAS2_9SPHI|nr:AAA family ATPase [Mucilaginibacter straminoryzae]MCJ8209087.1 AAA family ATPase [Mucilaginibacter straminoryzae]
MANFERPMEIEIIRQSVRESMNPTPGKKKYDYWKEPLYCSDDVFQVRKANDWMASDGQTQKPRMLFDNFWFEGELCILFADTNLGKSVLAVQLGNCIATGTSIEHYKVEVPASTVVYFDFEQSQLQFEARYSGYRNAYSFSPNFYRAELNTAAGDVRNYLDRIHYSIEETVKNTKAKVLIIDNLTYLGNQSGHAKEALNTMKFLKMLKSRYQISILALAHTPKRNPAKPITNNDMQGSKMLINFCDSAFAMGRSRLDPKLRYLKQIKQRNATELYGADRVCLFTLERNENFIYLSPCGCEPEHKHLFEAVDITDNQILLQIREWAVQGKSQREIARDLGISRYHVAKAMEGNVSVV